MEDSLETQASNSVMYPFKLLTVASRVAKIAVYSATVASYFWTAAFSASVAALLAFSRSYYNYSNKTSSYSMTS